MDGKVHRRMLPIFSHSLCCSVTKPGVDRSTKPQSNTFKDRPYGSALRTVIIPSRMLQTFLVLAQKNTSNNVETCGILAGKLVSAETRAEFEFISNRIDPTLSLFSR